MSNKNLFFVFIFLICAGSSWAQQQPPKEVLLNEVFHQVPLLKVLKKIGKTYSIKIAYDDQLVKNIIVDVVLSNATVEQCFTQLLQKTLLEFSIVNGNVIIAQRQSVKIIPGRANFAIAGVIVDGKTGETLPNVFVRIQGANLGTTTNQDGYFTLLQVPNDTLTIDFRYIGYSSQSVRLNAVSDLMHLNIKMIDETKVLETIVVSDEYNQALQIDDETSKIAFNPKTLRSLPALGEQDVFRTMQLMPGVSSTDESSAGMNIRGMHSSDNLVLLDGITIYQLDHFFGAFSILNSDIIKDVRVYRGGFDAKYGGRVSGVVDITSKSGNVVRPTFKIGSNFISLRATAEIPISPKFSLLIAGRRSYTDKIQNSLYEKLYDVGNRTTDQIRTFSMSQFNSIKPYYFFYDVNSKLTYRSSQKDVISLSLYNSADKLLLNDSSQAFSTFNLHEYTNWGNTGASLKWSRQWTKNLRTSIWFSGSRFMRNYEYSNIYISNTPGDSAVVNVQNEVTDLTLAIENEWLISDKVSIEVGRSNIQQRIDDEVENQNAGIHTTSIESGSSSIYYGTINTKLSDKLSISTGIRLNGYTLNNSILSISFLNDSSRIKNYIEPRFNFHYFISKNVKLKAAYAKNNQLISQVIINEHTGAPFDLNNNFWILSNDHRNIPVIASNHYTLGTTINMNDFILDFEFFCKRTTGIIDNKLVGGRSIISGLDVILQKTVGLYKGWIAYSLSNARESFSSFEDGKIFPSLYDQRHELKVVNMMTLGKWNLSSTWIYGSGKPYPTYTVDYSNSGYELIRNYDNIQRLPSYHRLDLAISYKIKVGKVVDLETGLSIFNVYNKKNIKTRKIDVVALNRSVANGTNEQPSYLDINLLDFTPSLFLNLSF